MFICRLSVRPSVCLFVCLSVCLVCCVLSVWSVWSVWSALSVCLSVCRCVKPMTCCRAHSCPSVCLSGLSGRSVRLVCLLMYETHDLLSGSLMSVCPLSDLSGLCACVLFFALICGSFISRSNAAPPAKDSLKKRIAYDQWALKHQRALPHSAGVQKHDA